MDTKHYDLVVIGGGAAGSTAARLAAREGRRVALVESHRLGGTCLNYGCDPTKALLHVARQFHAARGSGRFGIRARDIQLDWAQVQVVLRNLVDDIRGGSHPEAVRKQEDRGIDVYLHAARFESARRVIANGALLEGEHVLIATGAHSTVPPIPGLKEAGYITHVEACWLPALPQSMVVIGGGAVGVEFAQAFSRLGVKITLLEAAKQLLEAADPEHAHGLQAALVREGVTIQCDANIESISRAASGATVVWRSGGETFSTSAETILVAAGRAPNTADLALERAGVATRHGAIVVDDCLRTNVSGVWAAGDVTALHPFTHTASAQAKRAIQNMWCVEPRPLDYQTRPWAVYTSPALAHAGQSAAELRQAGQDFHTLEMPIEGVVRAKIEGERTGSIKLFARPDGIILGASILAENAEELLAPAIMAIQHGVRAGDLADLILPYPSRAEGLRWAAAKCRPSAAEQTATPDFCAP